MCVVRRDWLQTGEPRAQLGNQHFNSAFVMTPVPGHPDRARMKSYLVCYSGGRCVMQGRYVSAAAAALVVILGRLDAHEGKAVRLVALH